jgi:hypothetical protein
MAATRLPSDRAATAMGNRAYWTTEVSALPRAFTQDGRAATREIGDWSGGHNPIDGATLNTVEHHVPLVAAQVNRAAP